MCNVEQPKLEVLDDISYLHLMQIVWSYSEMSNLKEFAVELPFSQFAKGLIVFERFLVGEDFDKECNDVEEIRSRLTISFQDFISAVESSETAPPNLKEDFLKGIGYLFVNFNPIQPNETYPADTPS